MQDFQIRDKIHPKQHVKISIKDGEQYQDSLHEGIVKEILTTSTEHYRGIKVLLEDGTVGRVQEIIRIRNKK